MLSTYGSEIKNGNYRKFGNKNEKMKTPLARKEEPSKKQSHRFKSQKTTKMICGFHS